MALASSGRMTSARVRPRGPLYGRDQRGTPQREFIRQLACLNGYALDWSCVSLDQMADPSKSSLQHGDNQPNKAREINPAASRRERDRNDEQRER
jgi:hypothetical protein